MGWERQLAADVRLECALSKDRPMPSDVESDDDDDDDDTSHSQSVIK